MKAYYIEEFKTEEAYKEFLRYMLLHSEGFSLIYFRYRENEKLKRKTKEIYDSLKKFKKYSKKTQEWPGTVTLEDRYIYKIVFYRSSIECLDILASVKGIYEWNYPNAPMDLCFYRDGYCWMDDTSHEHMAYVYTDSKEEVETLRALGADLTLEEMKWELFPCDLDWSK